MDTIADLDEICPGAIASYDAIDTLLAQYRDMMAKIDQIADFMEKERRGAMGYFLRGNQTDDRNRSTPSADYLFRREGAVAALNSDFWDKAMKITDVLDMMPQARRDDWNDSISNLKCPPFEDKIVRDTIMGLLASRGQFLAERVDGIFKGLSGEHVTNSPAAFGKRMILASLLSMDYPDSRKCGLLNDLRCVIAKFMRRDEPKHYASDQLIRSLRRRWGEWVEVDGGSLKVRLYRKGTAHIEVHPDMAWRLNAVLAQLYPRAIPPEHRQRPRRQPKNVSFIAQRPLPFAVIHLLLELEPAYEYEDTPTSLSGKQRRYISNALKFSYRSREENKHIRDEAETVLESIGGVRVGSGVWSYWRFDYDPMPVIDQIVASGCIPDNKVHQFYPTRPNVAELAINLAQIGPEHRVLEPSAGLGGIADFLPKERTLCIEVSRLRCQVLEAKGHRVVCANFLAWAIENRLAGQSFDRIVMNPPFDQGQWRAHLEAAADLLAPGGRLVAILPTGAQRFEKLLPPGFVCTFDQTLEGAFAGTSQAVVLLLAVRAS